jgi:hypothetical protein
LGKLPVKVSLENGPIKIGDYLTSSNHPGVAMKATEPGKVIGIALESSEKCKDLAIEQCKIMVFVNPHWSIGSLAEDGSLASMNSEQLSSEQSIFDQFTLAIKNSLKKLGLIIENGIAQIKEIITEKLSAKVVVTNQLCLGQTCIDEAKLKELLERSRTMGTTNNQTTNNGTTNNGAANNGTTSNETVSNETTSNETMNNQTVSNQPASNETANNETTNNETTSSEQQTISNEQSNSEQQTMGSEQSGSEQSNSEQSNNEQLSNEQSSNLTEAESVSNNSEPSTTTTQ